MNWIGANYNGMRVDLVQLNWNQSWQAKLWPNISRYIWGAFPGGVKDSEILGYWKKIPEEKEKEQPVCDKCKVANTNENKSELQIKSQQKGNFKWEAKNAHENGLTANINGNPEVFYRHIDSARVLCGGEQKVILHKDCEDMAVPGD